MKIPKYPEFKIVDKSDFKEIREITDKFPPYCDFSFSNLYTWRPKNHPSEISIHNQNLIIRSESLFRNNIDFSFIGNNNSIEVINSLLTKTSKLSIVPEIMISKNLYQSRNHLISPDYNNYDYIYKISQLAKLQGPKFSQKRLDVTKFTSNYKNYNVKNLLDDKKSCLLKIEDVMNKWKISKGTLNYKIETEFSAIKRLVEISDLINLEIIGLYSNANLIGFVTIELIHRPYVLASFGKVDHRYIGITSMINHLIAKKLNNRKYKYINFEQDLGIKELRSHKNSWNPIKFLRKYNICKV